MSAAPQQHEMFHKGTDPSGAEEWLCHECGRHFVIRWPSCDRLVLDPGDESASHFGRKGDAALRSMRVSQPSAGPSATPESSGTPESSAAPTEGEDAWRRWLRQNGMDWDG